MSRFPRAAAALAATAALAAGPGAADAPAVPAAEPAVRAVAVPARPGTQAWALDATARLAQPFDESLAARAERVFFITLPFASLYAGLLTAAAGFAIEGQDFRASTPWVAGGLALAVLGSGVVAWRDARAAR